LGYRIAENQQALTPLQRKVLLYGYVHFIKSIQQQVKAAVSTQAEPQVRDLSELVHVLPNTEEEGKKG